MKKFQGAEATVTVDEDVRKDREEKNYRHPQLDERLRTERNKKETRIMKKALQHGVNTPEVLEKEETEFKMQKIEGKTLKNVLAEETGLLEKLAEQVARLHSANIIHGDLTTSNALVSDDEVYLIDFGLSDHSERVEDKAVDIHLLKQVLRASHTEELWKIFAERYRREGEEEVVDKVSEIEERARYK